MSYTRNHQNYSNPNKQHVLPSNQHQQQYQQKYQNTSVSNNLQQLQQQQQLQHFQDHQPQQQQRQVHPQQPSRHQRMQDRPLPPNPQQDHHPDQISPRPPAEPPFKPQSFSRQQNPILRLRPISDCNEQCSLLQRRMSKRSQHDSTILTNSDSNIPLDRSSNVQTDKSNFQNEVHLTGVLFNELKARDEVCEHCKENFLEDEKMVNLHGVVWHERCFLCAQCFQPFLDGVIFEFEGRRYCKRDFQTLFAPHCHQCKEFIMGRVIRAVGSNWHPECFKCQLCEQELADVGFVRNNKRSVCKDCHEKEKVRLMGKNICLQCSNVVDENDFLKFRGEVFHAYHFNCHTCGIELNSNAREKDKEMYCLRCYDKLGVPICAACRRPVEDKLIHALGKMWHVEHFVCCQCEKPFFGNRHYEDKGLAYCELHYYQMRGGTCFHCNSVITGNEFKALNKSYCEGHFTCFTCNREMDNKSKFVEFDGKPICKNCFKKFPSELVKRLKKLVS